MSSINEETKEKVSRFWDSANGSHRAKRLIEFLKLLASEKRLPVRGWMRSVIRSRGSGIGWWHNSFVVTRINERICGRAVDGRSQGIIEWLKDSYGYLFPLERGISVACANGYKESLFLRAGIVNRFDLYELSEKAIKWGRDLAHQLGLADRMNFRRGIAIEEIKTPGSYELVAWNDALHHMPDVSEALAWSRTILKQGGIFSMDDFVGPTRFQWPDRQLALATAIRKVIPNRYLATPGSPFRHLPLAVERPTIASMIALDPSEAADSERILPSLAKHFPEATVRKTGGVVYNLALHGITHNFDPEEDKKLLELLMIIDEQCITAGDTHYAAAIGRKREQGSIG